MPRTKKYSVFLVDDEPSVLNMIGRTLQQANYKVTKFKSAVRCLEKLSVKTCDLVVTDLRMDGMDGMELLRKIRSTAPWVPVIMITGYGEVPVAVEAIKLGAVNFIEKPLEREHFLSIVKTALMQDVFGDSATRKKLTKTEMKVLRLILQGKSNKDIAGDLCRCIRTIEFHRRHIMQKLGVDNLVELVKRTAVMDSVDSACSDSD